MSRDNSFPQWYVDDQHTWQESQRALMDALCAKMLADTDAAMSKARRALLLLSVPTEKPES